MEIYNKEESFIYKTLKKYLLPHNNEMVQMIYKTALDYCLSKEQIENVIEKTKQDKSEIVYKNIFYSLIEKGKN